MDSSPPPVPIDYRGPNRDGGDSGKSAGWRKAVLSIGGGFFAIILLIGIFIPSAGRPRETAQRVKCASNLRQIGQAALLYANDHQGQLPPDLVTLYRNAFEVADGSVLVCPSGNQDMARGTTMEEVTAAMISGDHLSYAWVGTGKYKDLQPDDITAFEMECHQPRDNARSTGINVLFSDGSIQFVDEKTAKAIHAQFAAGIRPIRLPPAGAASQPSGQ